MGYRDFTDQVGNRWQAWDVVPQLVERRHVSRRAVPPEPAPGQERRRGEDRRVQQGRRPALQEGMSHGWLCFESGSEKRRLTPVPQDWLTCAEAQLAEYCRQAAPARRSAHDGGAPVDDPLPPHMPT